MCKTRTAVHRHIVSSAAISRRLRHWGGELIALAQGAVAEDDVDGDVSALVTACQPGHYFARVGLAGCGFNTTTSGNSTIVFSYEDAATGAATTVSRTLVVLPACAVGEVPCTGGDCSVLGLCPSGHPLTVPGRPTPELRLWPRDSRIVYVPAGQPYEACTAGQSSLRDNCDAGVAASVSNDQGQVTDLTAKVLSCPPDACMPLGCHGHDFSVKGALQSFSKSVLTVPLLWQHTFSLP